MTIVIRKRKGQYGWLVKQNMQIRMMIKIKPTYGDVAIV